MANLTDADIRRPLQRAELTSLDNGDGIVVEDISDSKVKYIKRENLNPLAAKVEIADAGGRYTATDTENALQEIAGDGRTTETVKGNADDISTLDGRMDTAESDIDSLEDRTLILENEMDAVEGELVSIDESLGEPNGIATLDATGKIPSSQLPVSAMEYKGAWDASTGSYPTSPDTGDFWVVSVAGTVGAEDYDVGDAIVYNGSSWDKINKVEIAEEVSYDNSSSGLSATNVQDAIDEVEDRVDTAEDDVDALEALSLAHDREIVSLRDRIVAQGNRINTMLAEVYTDDPIKSYASTVANGEGYVEGTPVDISSTVKDGGFEDMSVEGLTVTNLVENGDFSQGTTGWSGDKCTLSVSSRVLSGLGNISSTYNSIAQTTGEDWIASKVIAIRYRFRVKDSDCKRLDVRIYASGDVANQSVAIVSQPTADLYYEGVVRLTISPSTTGTGKIRVWFHAEYDSGVNVGKTLQIDGNYGVSAINLTSHGLDHITDTDVLADLLPFVGGTQSVGEQVVRSVGKNLFDKSKYTPNKVPNASGTLIDSTIGNASDYIVVAPSKSYYLSGRTLSTYTCFYDVNKVFISNNGGSINGLLTTPSNAKYIRMGVAYVDMATQMLNIGSTATPYEPFKQQSLYLPSIGNRVPNGTQDTIEQTEQGWEHTQRVQRYVLQESDISQVYNGASFQSVRVYKPSDSWMLANGGVSSQVANSCLIPPYSSTTGVAGIGNVFEWDTDEIAIGFALGTYASLAEARAALAGTVIYFELATPIITPYPSLPHLPCYEGGSITRFAGSEQIETYGTGLTFSKDVLSVIEAWKLNEDGMEEITGDETIDGTGVTFSGVDATDTVLCRVAYDVDEPIGEMSNVPTVENTKSRLEDLEGEFEIITESGVDYIQFNN